MTTQPCFETLLLLARPAAGKSEIIDFLKKTPLLTRLNQFHVGNITEFDDFPMLWTWFEEDEILETLGYPRLYTDEQGYFKGPHLWDLLIRRLSLDHQKWQLEKKPNADPQTALMEFSRGLEHGGYKRAFEHLTPDVIRQAAVLYVDVPWEESLRKNRKRFNPEKPHSILEHSMPDAKLEVLYKEIDWEDFSKRDPEFLFIQGIKVPYVVFDNHDDVTTQKGAALEQRLKSSLDLLWTLRKKIKSNEP